MDEAAILLLGNRSGDATLSIIYEVDPDTVRVDARVVDDEPTELSGDRIERFVTLAGNLVDEWEVHAELGRISLAKRHAQ